MVRGCPFELRQNWESQAVSSMQRNKDRETDQKTVRGIKKWLSVRMARVFRRANEDLFVGAPVWSRNGMDGS